MPTKDELLDAFDTFDLDGSGTLSVDELVGIFTRPGGGQPMTHDDAMAFICQHDKDGDGELNIKEFLDAMMSASVPILDAHGKVIGQAPAAPRPEELPKSGKGIANVVPTQWSISTAQWLAFIDMCKVTDTWKALERVKGRYNINMYDVKDHFVVPWTKGTGCSVALLMNGDDTPEVDTMVSHAWAGSVVESYFALKRSAYVTQADDHLFFCTLSMYQPEDGAAGGLSIGEQLELRPFAAIIDSRPGKGMQLLHTTLFDLYKRTWTVHEVDEAMHANIHMEPLFDTSTRDDSFEMRWEEGAIHALMEGVNTAESECRPEDKAMLFALIEERGGFQRLDEQIMRARHEMSEIMHHETKQAMGMVHMRTAAGGEFQWEYGARSQDIAQRAAAGEISAEEAEAEKIEVKEAFDQQIQEARDAVMELEYIPWFLEDDDFTRLLELTENLHHREPQAY